MNTRDLAIEVCHDLINRALRCERNPLADPETAFDCRSKERALRTLIADTDRQAADLAETIEAIASFVGRHEGPNAKYLADRIRSGAWRGGK